MTVRQDNKEWGEALKAWLNEVLDWLYPPKCLICNQRLATEEKYLCPNCVAKELLIVDNQCPKCGRRLNPDEIYCVSCQFQVHIFEQGYSLFTYEEVKNAVLAMKYQRAKWKLVAAAELMAWLYQETRQAWQIEAIAYVPQHFLSLGEKGYNPARIVAMELCKRWELPLITNFFCHAKKKAQKKLGLRERQKNLHDIFYCKGKIAFENVLLIDDVYTSGSTIDACAQVLKQSGATQIYFLTIANGKEDY